MYYCKYINENTVSLSDGRAVISDGMIIGNPSPEEIAAAGYLPLIIDPDSDIDITDGYNNKNVKYTVKNGCVYASSVFAEGSAANTEAKK